MPGSAFPPFSSLSIPCFRTPSGGLFWGTQFPPLFHAGFSNSPKIAPGDTRGTHFPALAPVRLFPAPIQPGPCLGVGGGAGGFPGILGAKTRRAISGDTRGTHNPGILGAGIRQRDFPRTVGAPSLGSGPGPPVGSFIGGNPVPGRWRVHHRPGRWAAVSVPGSCRIRLHGPDGGARHPLPDPVAVTGSPDG